MLEKTSQTQELMILVSSQTLLLQSVYCFRRHLLVSLRKDEHIRLRLCISIIREHLCPYMLIHSLAHLIYDSLPQPQWRLNAHMCHLIALTTYTRFRGRYMSNPLLFRLHCHPLQLSRKSPLFSQQAYPLKSLVSKWDHHNAATISWWPST